MADIVAIQDLKVWRVRARLASLIDFMHVSCDMFICIDRE